MKCAILTVVTLVAVLALAGLARADIVGHWTFDGTTGLEDSSANPAANGTLVGTAVIVANVGPLGAPGNKVLSVTKTNNGNSRFNVVDPGTGSKFDLTTAGSIALWVYLDPAFANPSNQDGVPLVNNAEGLVVKEGGSYYLGNNGQQYKFRLAEWGTNNHTNAGDNLAGDVYGTWYHVAWTWDGTTSRIYVNGVDLYDQAYAGTLTSNDNPIAIGGRVQGDYSITGLLDDVRIYNTALSQSEIQALMAPIPEPATMSLLAIGGLAALLKRRRSA